MTALQEYKATADALGRWFESQEVPVRRACGVMSFFTGVCLGTMTKGDPEELEEGIKACEAMIRAIALEVHRKGQ